MSGIREGKRGETYEESVRVRDYETGQAPQKSREISEEYQAGYTPGESQTDKLDRDSHIIVVVSHHHVHGGFPASHRADSLIAAPVHSGDERGFCDPCDLRPPRPATATATATATREKLAPDLRPRPLLPAFSYADVRPRTRVTSLPRRISDASSLSTSPPTPTATAGSRRRNSISVSPLTYTISPTATLVRQPLVPPPSIPYHTMSSIPKFSGDYAVDNIAPADWLRSARSCYRERGWTTSPQKMEDVKDRFISGSIADNWFKDLSAAQRSDWAAFEAAFEDRFQAIPTVTKPKAQLVDELSRMRITMADLAAPSLVVQGQTVSRLQEFAHKVLERANAASAANGENGLWGFFEALPAALRVAVGTMPATWTAMVTSLRAISETTVKIAVEEYKAGKALQDEIQALKKKLETTHLSTPVPTPKAPTYTPNVLVTPPAIIPAQPNAGTGRVPRPPPTAAAKDRLRVVIRDVIAKRAPDNPEGLQEYERQLARWNARYGTKTRDELQLEEYGYPLKPGTLPPCSGECYRCGKEANPPHKNGVPCPSATVPSLERAFRAVCGSWLGKGQSLPHTGLDTLMDTRWM
ncbi:hypothetical protein C8F01DRAFT_1228205 [Mycena amicta]|nr:hypothetical protein C8F01DRAFT_1228205 [Mycena amicta]